MADLTGQPYAPADAPHARALAFVPDIRAALISLAYMDLPDVPSRPSEELSTATQRLMTARRVCDYADAASLVAPLLLDLGACAYSPASASRTDGLRLLPLTTYHAAFLLKYLGFVGDHGFDQSDRTHRGTMIDSLADRPGIAHAA